MTSQLISYFLSTQDWRTEAPYEQITIEEARRRKKQGDYFVPGTNGVMCQTPRFAREPRDVDDQPIKAAEGWRVVDQTAKPGIKHKATRIGPGFPRYALV
jgi:hypothetical protein